jgi:hypothetical protein
MPNELKEPKASLAKVAYHLKQLRKLFPRASDQQLLQMVWANSLADKEGDIAAEDRRHIIFCPIHSFAQVLSLSTEDSFLTILKAAREEKYTGWELREISRKESAGKEKIEPKKFPFELDGLLPWWKRSNEFQEAKAAEGSAT